MMWPIGKDVASVGEWAAHPNNLAVHHGTPTRAGTGSAAGKGGS